MRSMNTNDAVRQAIYALQAFLGSIHILNEGLSLFTEEPAEQTVMYSSCMHAISQSADWCYDILGTIGWEVGDMETIDDDVAHEVLRRVEEAIAGVRPRGTEALYLSGLVFIVDDFCALWGTLGRTCTSTPLPNLRSALSECLRDNYGLDLAAPASGWSAVLAGGRDLASRWQNWAAS